MFRGLLQVLPATATTTFKTVMAAEKARAFWITGRGQSEIRAEQLAAPSRGEVLVRALYSGISRGTETLVFHGGVPPSEYVRMRAPFQAGDFPAPVKYGYSSVGVVKQGPPELLGRTVFCLYPHQTALRRSGRGRARAARRRAAARAPCSRPIWRRRSTRCGMPRRESAIASP